MSSATVVRHGSALSPNFDYALPTHWPTPLKPRLLKWSHPPISTTSQPSAPTYTLRPGSLAPLTPVLDHILDALLPISPSSTIGISRYWYACSIKIIYRKLIITGVSADKVFEGVHARALGSGRLQRGKRKPVSLGYTETLILRGDDASERLVKALEDHSMTRPKGWAEQRENWLFRNVTLLRMEIHAIWWLVEHLELRGLSEEEWLDQPEEEELALAEEISQKLQMEPTWFCIDLDLSDDSEDLGEVYDEKYHWYGDVLLNGWFMAVPDPRTITIHLQLAPAGRSFYAIEGYHKVQMIPSCFYWTCRFVFIVETGYGDSAALMILALYDLHREILSRPQDFAASNLGYVLVDRRLGTGTAKREKSEEKLWQEVWAGWKKGRRSVKRFNKFRKLVQVVTERVCRCQTSP
ncbi:hypothetical protein IAT38_007219 [Cryptococcus sp. DSM 104549]